MVCREQDRNLKLGEQERLKMTKELEAKSCDMKDLDDKIRVHGNNINCVQKELDDNNAINLNLKGTLQDYERQCNNLKCENDKLKCNLCKEQDIRTDLEHKKSRGKFILSFLCSVSFSPLVPDVKRPI